MNRFIAVVGVASACAIETVLPPAPAQVVAPVFSGFSPVAAFAGETVTLDVVANGAPELLGVRVGGSAPVRPAMVGGKWQVTVPLDAGSGAIEFSNGQASATAAQAFRYEGPGHLRVGREVVARSLAPNCVESVSSSAREASFTLWSGERRVLMVDDIGYSVAHAEADGVVPDAIALTPSGDALAVVGPMRDGSCKDTAGGPGLAVNVYGLTQADDAGELGTLRHHTCLGIPESRFFPHVALNDDGTLVAVLTESAFAIGTVTTGVVQRRPIVDSPEIIDVSWMGANRFLAVIKGVLVRGVADEAPASWKELDFREDLYSDESVSSMAASAGGTVALGMSSGRVLISEGPAWPPDFENNVPFVATNVDVYSARAQVWSLAFSPDGGTLAIGQIHLDRVLIAQEEASWGVTSALTATRPTRVTTAADGFFVAATAEGAIAFSGQGAVRMATLGAASGLTKVEATRSPCAGGAPAFALGGSSFRRVYRLDAGGLADVACVTPAQVNSVVEVAANGSSAVVFERNAGGGIARIGLDGKVELNTHMGATEEVSGRDGTKRMALSPPGTTLVALDGGTTLHVFDAAATSWPDALPRDFTVPASGWVEYRSAEEVLLAEGDKLWLLNVADALRTGTARLEAFALPGTPSALRVTPRGTIVVESPDAYHRKLWVAGASGSFFAGPTLLLRRLLSSEFSADGRRLYLLVRTDAGATQIRRFTVDSAASTVVEEETPLTIDYAPDGHDFDTITSSTDGAHLLALDRLGEVAVVFE